MCSCSHIVRKHGRYKIIIGYIGWGSKYVALLSQFLRYFLLNTKRKVCLGLLFRISSEEVQYDNYSHKFSPKFLFILFNCLMTLNAKRKKNRTNLSSPCLTTLQHKLLLDRINFLKVGAHGKLVWFADSQHCYTRPLWIIQHY